MIKPIYKTAKLANGAIQLITSFEDENTGLAELLFNGELENFSAWIKNTLEAVLNAPSASQKISGNLCELVIFADYTQIYNLLSDEPPFEIPTKELHSLVVKWDKMYLHKDILDICDRHKSGEYDIAEFKQRLETVSISENSNYFLEDEIYNTCNALEKISFSNFPKNQKLCADKIADDLIMKIESL